MKSLNEQDYYICKMMLDDAYSRLQKIYFTGKKDDRILHRTELLRVIKRLQNYIHRVMSD